MKNSLNTTTWLILVMASGCAAPSLGDSEERADGMGGTQSLVLPFPDDEQWVLTRGYNSASHADYGYDWFDDRYALDFTEGGCDSWRKPITPVRSGEVIEAGYSSFGYGNNVVVDHGDDYRSRYGHFDEVLVEVGDIVSIDDEIGLTGNTGSVSGTACSSHPGTHLHFAYYYDGVAAVPEPMSGHTDFQTWCRYGHNGWIDCNGDYVNDNETYYEETEDCLDNDGDGYGEGGGCLGPDCNDNHSQIYPGAPERLDAWDNDCDGEIDEGLDEPADIDEPDDPSDSTDDCIWVVPSEVSTIQEALDLAEDDDVICVEEGDYHENLTFPEVALTLRSLEGADDTHLYGISSVPEVAVVTIEGGTSSVTMIEGFTVHGFADRAVWIFDADPTLKKLKISCETSDYGLGFFASEVRVENVQILDCGRYGVTAYGGSDVTFENLIVAGSGSSGLRAGDDSTLTLTNTVFYDNGYVGMRLFDASGSIENSIITNHTLYGISVEDEGYVLTSSYNSFYSNEADYGGDAGAGTSDRVEDPQFVGAGSHNYLLESDSPCTNSGDPDPGFNDADGSRNDRGAYGGPLSESWL